MYQGNHLLYIIVLWYLFYLAAVARNILDTFWDWILLWALSEGFPCFVLIIV